MVTPQTRLALDKTSFRVGLGWSIGDTGNAWMGPAVWWNGGTLTFHTFFRWLPKLGVGVFVSANTSDDGQRRHRAAGAGADGDREDRAHRPQAARPRPRRQGPGPDAAPRQWPIRPRGRRCVHRRRAGPRAAVDRVVLDSRLRESESDAAVPARRRLVRSAPAQRQSAQPGSGSSPRRSPGGGCCWPTTATSPALRPTGWRSCSPRSFRRATGSHRRGGPDRHLPRDQRDRRDPSRVACAGGRLTTDHGVLEWNGAVEEPSGPGLSFSYGLGANIAREQAWPWSPPATR